MPPGDFPFRKVAILGTGLMGGSFAGALKGLPSPPEILGTSRDPEDASGALSRGWVDHVFARNDLAVVEADLVVLAVPPKTVPDVWEEIAGAISPSAILTDLSSVKAHLFEQYQMRFQTLLPRYTSSHPMAGSERSGISAARPDLFSGRTVFLTPFGSDRASTESLEVLWTSLGAKTFTVTPKDHDGIVAHISHLPHVISYCLLNLAEKVRVENRYPGFDWKLQKGGSFSDILRIARSSPELWADIFSQNEGAILEAMDQFEREIAEFRTVLRHQGAPGMARLLSSWTLPLSDLKSP